MKISILLPFQNAAPWVDETIKSILNQTHQNWELIAVNDHSMDETQVSIERFKDSRIQVIKNKGTGIIPALQTALEAATGEFITRMDADDLMPPNKLEMLLYHMKSGRTVVTGKVKYFSESEVSEGYRTYENWLNERIVKKDHFQHIYRECVIASPNWLVSTQLMREDRIFDQLQYPEDYDMTFLWRKYGYEIVPVNEITHLWREHPARTSRNSDIYDQASFFRLKLDWFGKLEQGKTLGVFGAGAKGKLVVEQLKEHFEIHWFDHGFENYQAPVHGFEIKNPDTCNCDLLLLAVFPNDKTRLEDFVTRLGYTFGATVWYV